MPRQLSLNWLFSPKLQLIKVLESVVISSRTRDFQPLISTVTLFGVGLMWRTSLVLFSCSTEIRERAPRYKEVSVLLVKLVGWLFPWPVTSECPSVSWVLMETWSHVLGTRWRYWIISGLAGRKQPSQGPCEWLGELEVEERTYNQVPEVHRYRSFVAGRVGQEIVSHTARLTGIEKQI